MFKVKLIEFHITILGMLIGTHWSLYRQLTVNTWFYFSFSVIYYYYLRRSQHLILWDITAATTATTAVTPRFLKFQNSQPNLY